MLFNIGHALCSIPVLSRTPVQLLNMCHVQCKIDMMHAQYNRQASCIIELGRTPVQYTGQVSCIIELGRTPVQYTGQVSYSPPVQ